MNTQKKPECVMVVEEDLLLRQDIALRIAKLGYGIAGIMESAPEALGKIGLLKPDLVLMNILLADSMDGIEAVRKIQLEANLPVILLTTYAEQKPISPSLNDIPFTYLQVPLKERELELKLELALLRHRVDKSLRIKRLTLERQLSEKTRELVTAKQAMHQLIIQQHRDQSSLQRYSDALDDSADSIYLIDRTRMRFIDVNRTACERSGFSRDELLAMGPHDIKPDFSLETLARELDRIAAAQDRFGIIETRHRCKNNETYPVEIRLRATETSNEKIFVGIARDMTVRHQHEQALFESEEKLQQISQNMQQALWIRDVETRQVLYVTHAFEKIWGHTMAQIYTDPAILLATVHPEDRQRFIAGMESMWSEKHSMDMEFRLLENGNQIRWLHSCTFPIYNHEGKLYRLGGITEDITERKVNQEKLRLSKEQFHRLFETSPIGLALMDDSLRFMEVNPAFCNMLGYSNAEMTTKSMHDITHPDDRNISLKTAGHLLDGTLHNKILEKRYLQKNGEYLWCKMHGTIVRDRNAQPLYAMGMIENIDQLKRANEIRLAQEAAQKNALIREVHHRIKNHLQGVVGLMQQHSQKDNSCSNIIDLATSQINAVATVHGLQCNTENEDIDLLQLLNSIHYNIRNMFPATVTTPIKVAKSNSMHLNRDESVPIALALNELLINACKHGKGSMEISLKYNDDNDEVIISIENFSRQPIDGITPGTGLELVQALLQSQGVVFRFKYTNNHFLAEIILSKPIIQLYIDTE